jgi:hypothetical protein
MGSALPSNIYIRFIEGDHYLWGNFEVDELLYSGGEKSSAEYENEAGMLEDAIASCWKPDAPGEYYIKGFTVFYSKDYYGEVDADYSIEEVRPSTAEDMAQFYLPADENVL